VVERGRARPARQAARNDGSLHELLERLRWRLMYEWGDASATRAQQQQQDELRRSLGLQSGTRWSGGAACEGHVASACGRRTFRAGRQDIVIATR
jgi:hypothetical protein